MDPLDALVEARIRDWQRRARAGEAPPAPLTTAGDEGLESLLWKEIIALHAIAAGTGDTAVAARSRARARELQLWILLESTGRPRAAAHLRATLSAHLARLKPANEP